MRETLRWDGDPPMQASSANPTCSTFRRKEERLNETTRWKAWFGSRQWTEVQNLALTLLAISTPGERSRRGGTILAGEIHKVGAPWITEGVALGVARGVVEVGAILDEVDMLRKPAILLFAWSCSWHCICGKATFIIFIHVALDSLHIPVHRQRHSYRVIFCSSIEL